MLEAITHDEGQPLYSLSRCSLLTGLPEATIQAIAEACIWYRCEPG